MDWPSNFAMIENIKLEEEVDIDDLVLPSKPSNLSEFKIDDIKQEPLEEEGQQSAFEKHDSLGRHYKIKPFSCKFCDKSFDQVHEMIEHIKIHNSLLEVENLKNQVKPLKIQVEELELKLNNSRNSQSNVASKTRQKMNIKKKSEMEINREIRQQEVYQETILKRKKNINQLKETNNNVRKEERKSVHEENKLSIREYKCQICGQRCCNATGLKRHIEAVHEKGSEKMFPCELCGKNFDTKHYVATHKNAVHSEKIVECNNCQKIFSKSGNLKRHLRDICKSLKK